MESGGEVLGIAESGFGGACFFWSAIIWTMVDFGTDVVMHRREIAGSEVGNDRVWGGMRLEDFNLGLLVLNGTLCLFMIRYKVILHLRSTRCVARESAGVRCSDSRFSRRDNICFSISTYWAKLYPQGRLFYRSRVALHLKRSAAVMLFTEQIPETAIAVYIWKCVCLVLSAALCAPQVPNSYICFIHRHHASPNQEQESGRSVDGKRVDGAPPIVIFSLFASIGGAAVFTILAHFMQKQTAEKEFLAEADCNMLVYSEQVSIDKRYSPPPPLPPPLPSSVLYRHPPPPNPAPFMPSPPLSSSVRYRHCGVAAVRSVPLATSIATGGHESQTKAQEDRALAKTHGRREWPRLSCPWSPPPPRTPLGLKCGARSSELACFATGLWLMGQPRRSDV
jgi:hypothetical protein